jgi:hypothetical protein
MNPVSKNQLTFLLYYILVHDACEFFVVSLNLSDIVGQVLFAYTVGNFVYMFYSITHIHQLVPRLIGACYAVRFMFHISNTDTLK